MLGGELLGAYCLSEPQSGSDAAALHDPRPVRDGDDYVVDGTKAWITHGGVADFYAADGAAPADDGPRGISCLLGRRATRRACRPADARAQDGLPTPRRPRRSSSTTRGSRADRLIGARGPGLRDRAGRPRRPAGSGIAACAVGLAQAALDAAVAWPRERQQFGRPIARVPGPAFMLADMATAGRGRPGAVPRRGPPARRRPAVRHGRRRWPSCSPPTRRCG